MNSRRIRVPSKLGSAHSLPSDGGRRVGYHGNLRLLDAIASVLAGMEAPATAREIARRIAAHPSLSFALSGKTPHKTVQARLAIDILRNGKASRFFRFAPGTFGLRSLRDAGKYPAGMRHIYRGVRRQKQVSPHKLLYVDPSSLPPVMSQGFFGSEQYPLNLVTRFKTHWLYQKSPQTSAMINVVAFILLVNGESILTFEPTEYEEKHVSLKDSVSIGLQGVISEIDPDLFDSTKLGFFNAVEREVIDFMKYFGDHEWPGQRVEWNLSASRDIQYLGLVRDDARQDRKNTLGIVACVSIPRIPTEHRKLGYRNMRWRSRTNYPNDFSYFDGWSQYVFAGLNF